jgi:small subunit ribosomal protein S2
MPEIRDLLKAGAHFGHQKQKWNPKMAPYIFTERNNIHIIDLQKTVELVEVAKKFVKNLALNGETIFLVGTKRQAQNVIKEEAEKAEVPYVNFRWLGGMLTNFTTINQSVKKLKKYEDILSEEKRVLYKKKELVTIEKKKAKLERNLSGIVKMDKPPAAMLIVDPVKEHLAVHEAKILGIPVIAIIDTNGDPTDIDYVIPANDDGMRTISLITSDIIEAYLEGQELYNQKIVTEAKEKKEKPTRGETRSVAGRKVKVKRIATTEEEEKEASDEGKADKNVKTEAAPEKTQPEKDNKEKDTKDAKPE